jgi:capsular exopolysaccharide synthesis family protein
MDRPSEQNIFATYESESPIATELRRLYNNVKAKCADNHYRSFLVTSSVRGEGKSTIISNLAVTIAQFPQTKVLVVDADLRRPRMHDVFGVAIGDGLIDCLGHGVDPVRVIKKTRLPNLDVITTGGKTDEPSKLFESEMLAEFFAKMRFYYDIVLVDSAPVLAVSDTLFLSREIEGVLFVVLAGVTPSQVVRRAKESLVDARANLIGVVVNNVSQVLPYYYDYKYYGAYKRE